MTGLSAQGSNEKCFTLNSLFWNVLGLEFKGLNCPFHTMSHSVSMCGPPPFPYITNYLLSIFHIHTWCNPFYLLSIISYFPPSACYPYPNLSYSFFSHLSISIPNRSLFISYPYLSYSSFYPNPFSHLMFPLFFLSLIYPLYSPFLLLSLCSKRLLHNNFSNQYLSRYCSVSLSYQCLNPDTILLAIDINW